MSDTDQESMEIRLQRLRELRDRGPVAGAPGEAAAKIDPDEMQAKRQRLRELRERARSQPDAPIPTSAPVPVQQPRPAPQMAQPGGNGAAGNPANAVKQLAAQILQTLRTGSGDKVPGTAYTEDGIGNFVAMLKNKTELHPFFERIHKFCTSPGQDPNMMLKGVNLANLSRTVELMEQIEANGVRGLRERFGGQAGGPGGGAGMGAGMGGGFGAPRGPGAGGPGNGAGFGAPRGPGRGAADNGGGFAPPQGPGGGGLGNAMRGRRRAEAGGGQPAGPAAPPDPERARAMSDRVAQLEKTISELKARLARGA